MFKWLRKIRRTGKATSSSRSSGPGKRESVAPPRIEQQPHRFLIRQNIPPVRRKSTVQLSESIITLNLKTRIPFGSPPGQVTSDELPLSGSCQTSTAR